MEKYHSVHERDEASFDLSSTHRLPTVSAADALEDLEDGTLRYVSTGLGQLDRYLAQPPLEEALVSERRGGLPRGQITEVWGPPGSGKTAFGIQLVAGALADGHGAVWVDCAYTVSGRRMAAVTQAVSAARAVPDEASSEAVFSERLAHFDCPSIPHLVALLCRPTATSVPSNTAVVVIDSLATLINGAFPKGAENKQQGPPIGKGSGPSAKRLQTLQYLISALQKLAATRNCAVVVLSQCATKLQLDGGATLTPSLSANVWEQGISTRLVLFRDWIWKDQDPSTVWFAGVQKLEGKTGQEALFSTAAFRVESQAGLVEIQHDASQASVIIPAGHKRKVGDAGLEIPDSDEDDEDFGWRLEDDAAAPVPPQTQGSEDLILGVHRYEDDDEDANDDANDETDDGGLQDGVGVNGTSTGPVHPSAQSPGGGEGHLENEA